ncbi:MAG: DUF423 domain-containing protein [Casimicrobiaceae bacterium]
MSARLALMTGAVAMFLAVALGAFGAHALKARLAPDMAAVWQTAVQYHAWHALALLATGILLTLEPARGLLGIVGWLFIAGIVLFSGSLYLLALTGTRGLGAITPLGGVAWLAGWAVFAWAVLRPS